MKRVLLTLISSLMLPGLTSAQVMEKKTLSIEGARKVIAAAVAEAKRLNAPGGVIAVVDDGGNLMALERLDNTFAAGANISIGKARTAVLFKRPTKVFEDIIKNGRTSMVALNDFTPLQGGVPIMVDGQVIGGVGVSGAASAQQDEELAIAGANAAKDFAALPSAAMPGKVTYFEKEKVASAFAKGAVLFDGSDAMTPREVNVEVVRLDPAVNAIVPPNPKIFKLAEGFKFTEGPVWIREGYLLFSEPNSNKIYKYASDGRLTVFREKSGYDGADIAEYGQPGSNGLTLDSQGRLTINEHGNRRVVRLEKNGEVTVLADRYQGKRLNSPNDLVYRSDGTLYFTDPPFGLPKFFDDPRKELPFSGVFCLFKGELKLVSKDFTGPNGLAFSPDEKYLYVGNWDDKKKIVMRYEVQADGSLKSGQVFFDMTSAPGEDALDGLKVDQMGNVYVSGPGGIWILSPVGKHLGTIIAPMHPHNFAWGDEDGKTLYLCARSGLYRMRLNIPGIRP